MSVSRRELLLGTTGLVAASAVDVTSAATASKEPPQAAKPAPRAFNADYRGQHLNEIAFPLGGMGAGMFCLEGAGALSKFSLRHRPDLASTPIVFAAVAVRRPRPAAWVLEGQVPDWKRRPRFPGGDTRVKSLVWGFARFQEARFDARFPFATVHLDDEHSPFAVEITGWSPFIPGDADSASLPVAGLEYKLINRGQEPIDAVFSFHSENFLAPPRDWAKATSADRIQASVRGFTLYQPGTPERPWEQAHCAMWADDPGAKVKHAWYGGGVGLMFDTIQMLWNDIGSAASSSREPLKDSAALGASIFVPFNLAPKESKTFTVRLAWHVPKSNVFAPDFEFKDSQRVGVTHPVRTYEPWYSARFNDVEAVKSYWDTHYSRLRDASARFSRAFYDSTLPPEIVEAVAANLTILKSPTVLRQPDGRLWAWEGSGEDVGAGGPGSCTHVWNYAQALPHLFPDLERGLRETEFGPDQGKDGFQVHRAALPIRPMGDAPEGRVLPAAADGQLGGIIKVYREWRISGDTEWLKRLWPKVRASLDFCIRTWDPKHQGWIREPHLTTYDARFWGPDSLCTSVYLGALKAATLMAATLHEPANEYGELLHRGIRRMENDLFNGEYFFQRIEGGQLQSTFPQKEDFLVQGTDEERQLTEKEGPPYQCGSACLADGVMGLWLCLVSGVDEVLDSRKVESHLTAVYRYNMCRELGRGAKVGRSIFFSSREAGLLNCTWPRGGRPSIPMIFSDEVWTGVEYQVAAHLIALGKVTEGLDIVQSCRARYDGHVRNPFAELEAGHWYARAMSSYSLLQVLSGARADAVENVLYLTPTIKGDYRSFLSTATGYGTVGVRDGKPFLEVVSGTISYSRIEYQPA